MFSGCTVSTVSTVSVSPPVSQDEEPNMTAGPNLVLLQEAGQQQKNLSQSSVRAAFSALGFKKSRKVLVLLVTATAVV
jgi:hypothetical protein